MKLTGGGSKSMILGLTRRARDGVLLLGFLAYERVSKIDTKSCVKAPSVHTTGPIHITKSLKLLIRSGREKEAHG